MSKLMSSTEKRMEEIREKSKAMRQACIAANELKTSYPGGPIQLILDNLPEQTPSYFRNYFLKLKEKSDKYKSKHIKLDEHQEKIRRELDSLIENSFDFLLKNKKFFISQIEETFILDEKQRFVLNGALSIFGKKIVKTYLPKFIKENEELAKYFYDSYESLIKIVNSKDYKCLWENFGIDICKLYLKRKDSIQKEETNKAETVLQEAFDNSVEEEKFNKKLSELETKERNLDKQRESLEERLNAIALVEEKYSNLLKELESKSSNLATENNSEEPEKITGEAVIATPTMPEVVEVEKESKVDYSMDGFSATESAVIKHMEDILRHKKGTQNIWIDDETDREHTFLSTIKISRGVKIISDKKEILDYYKESRNVEKI